MAFPDTATDDGYDCQMQTNHLSHFLLTSLLFPLLERKSQAVGETRVVNHSSMAAWYPSTRLSKRYLGKNGGDLGGLSVLRIVTIVGLINLFLCLGMESQSACRWCFFLTPSKILYFFPYLYAGDSGRFTLPFTGPEWERYHQTKLANMVQ